MEYPGSSSASSPKRQAKMGAALLIDKIGGLKKNSTIRSTARQFWGSKARLSKCRFFQRKRRKEYHSRGIPYVTENVVATIEQSVLEIEENTLSED